MRTWVGSALVLGFMLGATAGAQDLQACGGVSGWPVGVGGGVFRGTLGGRSVTAQLGRDSSAYYYGQVGIDIQLTAFHDGQTLILQEEVQPALGEAAAVTGCLTLKSSGAGLTGTWRKPGAAGGGQPVTLKPLDVAQVPLILPGTPGVLKLRREQPLAFLKLNSVWVRAADGRSVREPRTGLTYPRVPGASAALDRALLDRQLENAANALDCAAQLPEASRKDDGMGYTLSVSTPFLTPRLLSVKENAAYYCGGAHPDEYTTGVVLDRASGREVKLTAIWPGLNGPRQTALYLARLDPKLDPECVDVLKTSELEFTANLTGRGLNLTPTSLPHVVAACAETVAVPFAALRSLASKASPYFRDLYAR